ncbi:hypothetical protein LSTR_LSTR013979 [Laodelphax striatellus]|uniref:RRM domain-containing protein n=1 Tax=Laodelphax striatellus TaxID=195883 RepID=A0A482XHW3_LAOST|nr:hypothetical protein LSTR_LSTR013979 [Laodelphax striatellus]
MGDIEYEDANRIIRDPNTVKARIFIGNTPTNVTKRDLEEVFSPHGKIVAIVLNRGFAFLQYSNERSAQDAIEKECGRMCGGKKLDVKHAVVFKGGQKGRNEGKDDDRGRERSPIRDDVMNNDRMGFNDHRLDMPQRNDRFGPGFVGGPRDDSFPSTEYPIGGPGTFAPGYMGMARDSDGRYPQPEFPPVGNMPGEVGGPFPVSDRPLPGMMPPREPFREPINMHSDRINDCEIIVLHRAITMNYADFVERRLKDIGLTVDVLFPNDDVPLGRILANISGRGALYAIVVAPVNEQHRSLTVNILYGQHQEHRNMPMEDAISLIRRTFQSYMRGERELPGTIGGYEVHPDAIQTLFNLLKENRQLTVLQYDKVIRYLQEKRALQLKLEVGDDPADLPTLQDTNSNSSAAAAVPVVKQQELQSRIMNILKKKGAVPADEAPAPVPAPDQWQSAAAEGPSPTQQAPPLLKNPNVQMAIDSLLRNLKPKSDAAPPAPVPAPTQPMFSAYASSRKY